MVHGKKGFGRIAWAFKNVLNHAVTWLLLADSHGLETAREIPYGPIQPNIN
jgi:ribonuclease P/MRP protein subunit RPP40